MIVQLGDRIFDRYHVEALIGQGGMSYVYRCIDERLERAVAVKVLKSEFCEDEEFVRKFRQEALAAAKLNHPNIVAAYDVIDEGKLHCIVSELVEGITLKKYIQKKGRLENEEAIGIALQVADGMWQAHRMGIVHRDIKPQNMIVGEDGVVKVADFGIARASSQQSVNAIVLGSVHYISPEQARRGQADQRSDIYSFGCTLFEMLTGRVPFEGDNAVTVVMAHLETEAPRVRSLAPEVSPALDCIVARCLQKKPQMRYQSEEELLEHLRMALAKPNMIPPRIGSGEGLKRPGLRGMQAGVLGGAAVYPRAGTAAGASVSVNTARPAGLQQAESGQRELPDEAGAEAEGKGAHGGSRMNQTAVSKRRRLYLLCGVGGLSLILLLGLLLGVRLLGLNHESGQPSAAVLSSSEAQPREETINITISEPDAELQAILGMDEDEASRYLEQYRLKLKVVAHVYSERYKAGQIVSYPSLSYESGDTVEVTVSKGSQRIDLSDEDRLHQTSLAELETELKARGIEYSVREAYSDSVPEKYLIAASKQNTSESGLLILTVSKGPEPQVILPSVLGEQVNAARRDLEALGLRVQVQLSVNDTVPVNTVLSQIPAAQTMLHPGDSVQLVVAESGVTETDAAGQSQSYWYSNINEHCIVGQSGPGIDKNSTVLISIRLRQFVNGEYRYTSLQAPRSYVSGSEIQVVFGNIKGVAGVDSGVVEVVDASTDTVLHSFGCGFGP